jgi:hypothetical protein
MQQSIVCGVDASDAPRSAADVAAALACSVGHDISIIDVARCAPTFPEGRVRDRRLPAKGWRASGRQRPGGPDGCRRRADSHRRACTRGAGDDDVLWLVVGFRARRLLRSPLRALPAAAPVAVVAVPPALISDVHRRRRRLRRRRDPSHATHGRRGALQFTTRDDGTLGFAGSPRELEELAEMVRHAARRGDPQIGMLMNDEGVTPIIVASHDETRSRADKVVRAAHPCRRCLRRVRRGLTRNGR